MEQKGHQYMNFFEYQELDRKRISTELHDTSLQDLTHIIHQIELSGLYIDTDPTKVKLELEDINNQLRRIIQDIRNTIFDLRPMSFDDLGLEEAIIQYIDFIQNKYAIIIEYQIDNLDYLEEQKKLSIYRIVQECLMNSAKHANANKINLLIKDNKSDIILSVTDDGIGIDNSIINIINPESDNKHYGLSIIKERVSYLEGKCNIISNKDEGTKIEITIPNKKEVSYEN